jgi:phosphatidyl-myo-inositol dimannoside synthase
MRTLLFAPELFRAEGGIARILRAYLHALRLDDRPGDQTGILVLNDAPGSLARIPTYLRDTTLAPIVTANRNKLHFITAALRYARTTDRIICGHIHIAMVARLAQCLNPKLRYHIIVHGIEVWRPYTNVERHVLSHAHRVICVSEYTRSQMLRFMPTLDPKRLVIVPNTLDPDFVLPPAAPTSQTPFNRGPRILTVARLTTADTYKGVDTLIEAMPLIRQHLPHARLRIVGGGNDEARLHALAARHGGPGVVDLLGRIDDEQLRTEYAACDFFALPSRKEGFGLVYLEAMLFGKPCLGARAGGAPEVITDAVGELVPYGHLDEIADACVRIAQRTFDPQEFRSHLENFSFDIFRTRLAAALAD